LLHVENLRVSYAGGGGTQTAVLRGIDFHIAPGEVLGVLGESGCGKTTLALSILSLLPASTSVKGSIRFLGQNLLVLPEYVTYATSTDGNTFSDEVKVHNPNNPNPKENPDIAKIPVQSFRADLGTPVKARYIKVHGESMLRMPYWHIRAGQPAWIYTDQIMVE